jgi:hypothetical protein
MYVSVAACCCLTWATSLQSRAVHKGIGAALSKEYWLKQVVGGKEELYPDLHSCPRYAAAFKVAKAAISGENGRYVVSC